MKKICFITTFIGNIEDIDLPLNINMNKNPDYDSIQFLRNPSCYRKSMHPTDVFVLENLGRKRNGSYLEIGAGWYQKINNTFVLEKFYGWKGLSIDIDKKS